MLKIIVLAVGQLKNKHWRAAQEEYLAWLRPMARVELVEVQGSAITASFGPMKAMKKEAESLLKRIPEGATVAVLDVNGKTMPSEEFAERLDAVDESGGAICFVVGGAAGIDPSVLKRTDWRLSLSPMTFTHEMARVLLLEQVYRGLTISSGKKYHY
jgi:23S rRNA (pseudouridine1915-N3)-methyltransferase